MHKLWIAIRRFLRGWSLPKALARQRWIVFDDGRVAFLAPTDYAMHREADETVAVHPPGDDSGITLRFGVGNPLLLMGPSGSGKTTLANVVAGLYRPSAGRVAYVGESGQSYDALSARPRVGYVPQDILLFHGSVRDNLVGGQGLVVDDVLIEALFASGSNLLLLPVQDVFGWRDRINEPALVSDANWSFRLPWPCDRMDDEPEARERQAMLRTWAERHGRR